MYLVDTLHSAGVGVIIDWVPGHFPKDSDNLALFDGFPLFEYSDPKKGEHKEWGTLIFDYGREEVQSFLVSNAMYWFDVFHVDGLRVDAVASMIYLDYNRQEGEWGKNSFGGKEHLEAIAFLRKLNTAVFEKFPYAMMIAEESTSWAGVTKPVHDGGLGFNFKWNMGWMHDTLQYMGRDPLYRRHDHNKMTFSFVYTFDENFILPLSHDEVVHGKKSLIDKMWGNYDEKFAALKAYYAYMTAHPGKKLLFMGGEFGQFIEWNCSHGLDWLLLDYPSHKKLQEYVSDLNHFYLQNSEFWELDNSCDGLFCISADDADNNAYVFSRKNSKGGEIFCAFNFSPVEHKNYRLNFGKGKFEIVFGPGGGVYKSGESKINKDTSFECDIPAYGALFFKKAKGGFIDVKD
jgi:1,4-alpha-glucan branching enzyme